MKVFSYIISVLFVGYVVFFLGQVKMIKKQRTKRSECYAWSSAMTNDDVDRFYQHDAKSKSKYWEPVMAHITAFHGHAMYECLMGNKGELIMSQK